MFYHGINREYVYKHYPILSPRKGVSSKSGSQLKDRQHLLELFGLEPIHLLEESSDYPKERCIAECLQFGDTVFAFATLPEPLWQLSRHEVGVTVLDLRRTRQIYTRCHDGELDKLFPGIPQILLTL